MFIIKISMRRFYISGVVFISIIFDAAQNYNYFIKTPQFF